VTGEGIETPEQLGQLLELGCQQGQGYLFAEPLTCDAVVELLATSGQAPAGSGPVHEQHAA
jgi:EAL domain-containing protein (putative c-di-GMP-specific phosphodiesterase class I)